jgi:hypothetical protein
LTVPYQLASSFIPLLLLPLQVERLGKAAVDSLTTSSEQAAADPTNLKGKSSDNKPDGTEVRRRGGCEAVCGGVQGWLLL